VSALVTSILVGVTWRYVRLTRELAETARRELDFLQAQHAAGIDERKRRAFALIWHLRAIANALPAGNADSEKIRQVALWQPTDLDELRRLAVPFGTEIAELASEAARHLATLAELAKDVQEKPLMRGPLMNLLPWDRWTTARSGAERCLTSITTLIERTV